MKIVIIILTTFLMQVSAAGLAQRVTFNNKNATLEQIFAEVRKQTGYNVLWPGSKLDIKKIIKVEFKNASIDDVMKKSLETSPMTYAIDDKTILIKEKKPSLLNRLISVFAEIDIRGRIVNSEMNLPLAGATITVKGNAVKGTKTNADGAFYLQGVDEKATIVISFVGYKPTEVAAAKDMGTIELIPESSDLKEVTINTGYQTIKNLNSTGSAVTIGTAELEKRNTINILDNLEGIVPGLVQYHGNTTIRGVSTMRANSGVLVVVDGLPIEGSVADLNPYDIETINVLKDAASASIYGARASNGVIVVTTKRAKQVGKTAVEFSTNFTYSEKPDYSYRNFMTGKQQVDWESGYYDWYFNGAGGTVADPIATFESDAAQGRNVSPVQDAWYRFKKNSATFTRAQLDETLNNYRSHTFYDEYKDHALLNQLTQQYNLAIRTNNGRAQSSLVLNYRTDNGGIINAYNRQVNIFYKGSYTFTRWFDVDYGVNSVIGKTRSHGNTFALDPFAAPAYASLFEADGGRSAYYLLSNKYNTVTETNPALYSLKFNHLNELERDFSKRSSYNTRYYVNMNIKPFAGLTINPMFQYEDNRWDISAVSEAESYRMRILQDMYTTRSGNPGSYTYTNLLPKGGRLSTSQYKSPNYTARAQANYNREFNKHAISAIAGAEFRQTHAYGSRGVLFGYDDQLQTQSTNAVNFANLYNVTSSFLVPGFNPQATYYNTEITGSLGLIPDARHRYASAYTNVIYTFDRKYTFSGSARKDYADLFGGDKKYRGRPLWSVGAAWVASNETFLSGIPGLNFLKLRGSYGLTGNIDANTTAVLTASTGVNAETQLPQASVTDPPNAQLRWEKTTTTNLGTDFSFFNNRLKGSFDWYHRKGTDLFAQKRLDPSDGFTTLVINNAGMLNKGVELSLAYDWFKPASEKQVSWSSNLIITHNKNKITYVDDIPLSPAQLTAGGAFRLGYPVRSLFSYQYAGLDGLGRPQFYKADGSKSIQLLQPADINAIVFSGGTDPRTVISFNNDISYQRFSLSIYAVYYGGHFIRARQAPSPIQNPGSVLGALPAYLLNGWSPGNNSTDIPGSGQYYNQAISSAQLPNSDFLVRPADFIKIRNIVLAYNMPRGIATKISAKSISLRAQVNNPRALWMKQKDIHIDAETNGMPIPTSYVFGLNINF